MEFKRVLKSKNLTSKSQRNRHNKNNLSTNNRHNRDSLNIGSNQSECILKRRKEGEENQNTFFNIFDWIALVRAQRCKIEEFDSNFFLYNYLLILKTNMNMKKTLLSLSLSLSLSFIILENSNKHQ